MKMFTSLKRSLRVLTPLLGFMAVTFVGASQPVLRFAVLGDAEPKPDPVFPHMEAAVHQVNGLTEALSIDFVVGVGDIAHKGTMVQYEAATAVLKQLRLPFYPIMGNEEHGSTIERYLKFAKLWNSAENWIPRTRYVLEFPKVALVFASPDYSREFSDESVDWMLKEVRKFTTKPVILIVHAAQAGIYREVPDKGVHNRRFLEVLEEPNLAAIISGDLHMDMDRVRHSFQHGEVHYLHIPALERTKIPDEEIHRPMFRVVTVYEDNRVDVSTYSVGENKPLEKHFYTFVLKR